MDEEREQKIRERAYALWEEQGRPDGRDAELWLMAEEELRHQEGQAPEAPVGDPAAAEDSAVQAA